MATIYLKHTMRLVVTLFSMSMIFGCAGMEYNTKQDKYPYHYIHKELQDADRAVEGARQAGKNTKCPVEFKAAEDLKEKAYSVYAACHTQEGIALAREATAKANALCPGTPFTEAAPEPPIEEKVIILASEPKVEEKLLVVVAAKPKVIILAFEDVHFDFDQSTLKPETKTILKRNIQLLKDNPKAKIRIAGYTSASGTEEYNQKLSERRAQAVQAYLVDEGIIVSERLSTIGYGETHPATYEAAPKQLYSPAAKSNMRVLFEIVVQ